MAIQVAKLVAKLGFKLDMDGVRAFRGELQKLKRDVGSGLARAANQGAGAVDNLGNRSSTAMAKASKSSGGFLKQLYLIKETAGVALAAVGRGASNFVGELTKANATAETLKTRLTTLVGSPEEADKTFKRLERFAAETPFELADIADMYIQLEGAGFKMSEGNMRALGDLSAASNKSLGELTEMLKSSGRGMGAMVDNFLGLAGKAEKGKMRLTNARTGADVLVDPKDRAELIKFFTAAGKAEGIAGGMEALSKTISGMQSRMQENFRGFLRLVGQSGFNAALKDAMVTVMGLDLGTGSLAVTLGQRLGQAIRMGTRLVTGFIERWRQIKQVGFWIMTIFNPFWRLALIIEDVSVYLRGGKSALGMFLEQAKAKGGNLYALAMRLQRFLGIVRGFGQTVQAFFSGGKVSPGLERIRSLINRIISVVASGGPSAFGGLASRAMPVIQQISGYLVRLWNIASRLFSHLYTVGGPAFRLLWTVGGPVLKLLALAALGLLTIWLTVWSAIAEAILFAMETGMGVVEAFGQAITSAMQAAQPYIEQVAALLDRVVNAIGLVGGVDFSGIGGKISGLLGSGASSGPGSPGAGAAAAAKAAGVGGGGVAQQNNTVQQTNNINITASSDPNAIAAATGKATGQAGKSAATEIARSNRGGVS